MIKAAFNATNVMQFVASTITTVGILVGATVYLLDQKFATDEELEEVKTQLQELHQ